MSGRSNKYLFSDTRRMTVDGTTPSGEEGQNIPVIPRYRVTAWSHLGLSGSEPG